MIQRTDADRLEVLTDEQLKMAGGDNVMVRALGFRCQVDYVIVPVESDPDNIKSDADDITDVTDRWSGNDESPVDNVNLGLK